MLKYVKAFTRNKLNLALVNFNTLVTFTCDNLNTFVNITLSNEKFNFFKN